MCWILKRYCKVIMKINFPTRLQTQLQIESRLPLDFVVCGVAIIFKAKAFVTASLFTKNFSSKLSFKNQKERPRGSLRSNSIAYTGCNALLYTVDFSQGNY